MSKRAIEKAYDAYPLNESNRYNHEQNAKRVGYLQGYDQAEKDIETLILKYLDSRNDRDYATVGWIKKYFGVYKKEIMEEE